MPIAFCLIIATFLWGSSFVSLKFAISSYDPIFVMFFRMITTFFVCLLLWRWVKRFRYRVGDWKYLIGMSLAEPCLYFLFEGNALRYTSASQAGVIISCLPMLVAILAYFMLKERLSKAIVIGFTLCIVGSVSLTLLSPHSDNAPNPLLGNLLEFAAMLCAAYYSVSVKYLLTRYSPLSLIAIQGASGTLFFGTLLCFIDFPQHYDIDALLNIIYLGSVVTLGAYGLYNYALSKTSILKVAAYSNLTLVFSLVLSALLLGEVLNIDQWLSVGVVILGILISQLHNPLPLVPAEENNVQSITPLNN
ncbi:DMT family transporter [Psychromonas sp. MME2]|uniref:DMT family transporter n=1 Tax=unclassified Psychromonas TaxID=2614957 RepID=UPI00339C00C6